MANYPSIAREVIAEIWRAEIAGGMTRHLNGSFIGRTEAISTPIILSEIPIFLCENVAPPVQVLENFLISILQHGDAEVLRLITADALTNSRVRGEVHILWLAVAALLSPDQFTKKLSRKLRSKSSYIWTAHKILTVGAGTLMNGTESSPQLKMSISVLGKVFNNLPMATGDRRRAAGDAAQEIRGLIHTLAGLATIKSTRAFSSMLSDPSLHEWHDNLLHSQAEQLANFRNSSFKCPTSRSVGTFLAGSSPVNMPDFQALAVSILDDIATEIRGDNANIWKSFWTLAEKGKLGNPKIENDCRDVMLLLFRPYLHTRNITIEPEGSAADQKRVDIRMTHAETGTLPIEIKRDDNNELWSAMKDQLQERYTNDSKTGGYGIYLVFWFGELGRGCKSAPKELDIAKPKTAMELKAELERIKPDMRILIRVIDVSKPHD